MKRAGIGLIFAVLVCVVVVGFRPGPGARNHAETPRHETNNGSVVESSHSSSLLYETETSALPGQAAQAASQRGENRELTAFRAYMQQLLNLDFTNAGVQEEQLGVVKGLLEGLALGDTGETDLALLYDALRGLESHPLAGELAAQGSAYLYASLMNNQDSLLPELEDDFISESSPLVRVMVLQTLLPYAAQNRSYVNELEVLMLQAVYDARDPILLGSILHNLPFSDDYYGTVDELVAEGLESREARSRLYQVIESISAREARITQTRESPRKYFFDRGGAIRENSKDKYLELLLSDLRRNNNLTEDELQELFTFLIHYSPSSIPVFAALVDTSNYDETFVERLHDFASNYTD